MFVKCSDQERKGEREGERERDEDETKTMVEIYFIMKIIKERLVNRRRLMAIQEEIKLIAR